jgi:hypothetical protein
MKAVFEWGGPNFFDKATTRSLIQVEQSEVKEALFRVTYGLQVKSDLTYSQACTEIGVAILHLQCCNGIASNEGR